MAVQRVPIADITLDPRLQMRATMDFEVIDEYAENLEAMPPCKIVKSPETDGEITMWLTSGWHRYHAHKKAGKDVLPCIVKEGTFDDAVEEAAGENHGHGIRRTTEDKTRAVTRLLLTPKWADKSDRMIADACHVSPFFVGKVRSKASTDCAVSRTNRVGKDKKSRPAPAPRPPKPAAGLPGPQVPDRFKNRIAPASAPTPSATNTPSWPGKQHTQLVIDTLNEIADVLTEAVGGSEQVIKATLTKCRPKLAFALEDIDKILNRLPLPIVEILYDEVPCDNPVIQGPCHVFRDGKTVDGYGQKRIGDRPVVVHRYVWERKYGLIPTGLVIDHRCRNRACCNTDHLRVVTRAVNATENVEGTAWQVHAAKTHCPQGHPYDQKNTRLYKGMRYCRACTKTVAKFVRPTVEEVKAYCQERKNQVDPNKWLDYYTANGFKVGKNSMKDWKAAVRNWEGKTYGGQNHGRVSRVEAPAGKYDGIGHTVPG